MATSNGSGESTGESVAAVFARTGLVAATALVETAALGSWLLLVRGAPVYSLSTVAGFTVLGGGLIVAYFLTDVAVNGRASTFPGVPAITVVLIETTLWALWLGIAARLGGVRGIALAGAVLAVLLVPQHTTADNVLRGRWIGDALVDLNALGFSVVQAGGATLWLLFVRRGDLVTPLLADADALFGPYAPLAVAELDPSHVGLAVLAGALFVEHVVGVSFSRHGERSPATDPVAVE